MASPGVFAAFAFAIIVIAMWSGWVVRTGRGGSHVRALPVLVLALVAVLESLAIRTVLATPDGPASEKASLLAEHISRGMRYFACAWGSVGIALVVLAVLSLRRPRDADAPTARVVRDR
ncbi:MAG TPA: hypothetical protein VLT45_28090 [Kofleriaceae bacterium]|nr:hypothetical protein [Kofleriaceae bacterium]